MSINRVLISGNLTRDPEMRVTQGGTPILSSGVAVHDRRRNQQTGGWEDYPNFVDCTVFGTRADALTRYLSKGAKVAIDGKLRFSSWEKDGQRRSKLEVIVDEIEFLSRPHEQAPQAPGAPYPPFGHQPAPQGYTPRQAPQQAPRQAPQQVPQQVPQMPRQAQAQQPLAAAPQATPAVASVPQAQAAPMDLYEEDIPF